jgi:hypothetical protein
LGIERHALSIQFCPLMGLAWRVAPRGFIKTKRKNVPL